MITCMFPGLVQDRDILEEVTLPVTVAALVHLLPGHILETQGLHQTFRAVALAGKGKPVEEYEVFIRYIFHHGKFPLVCCTPLLVRGGHSEPPSGVRNWGTSPDQPKTLIEI